MMRGFILAIAFIFVSSCAMFSDTVYFDNQGEYKIKRNLMIIKDSPECVTENNEIYDKSSIKVSRICFEQKYPQCVSGYALYGNCAADIAEKRIGEREKAAAEAAALEEHRKLIEYQNSPEGKAAALAEKTRKEKEYIEERKRAVAQEKVDKERKNKAVRECNYFVQDLSSKTNFTPQQLLEAFIVGETNVVVCVYIGTILGTYSNRVTTVRIDGNFSNGTYEYR